MRALIILVISITFLSNSFSQKSPIKYGDVSLEELKMVQYEADSSAEAVILVDYGEAYLSANTVNIVMNFERHTRIKILKKEGLSYANIEVPLYHSGSAEEKIISLKATTYNLENGKMVETKMAKDAVFKEKFNKNINIHKFTLPNVKEGSVVEYSYKISSEFFTNFPDWEFQSEIPTVVSEFWAIIPEFFIFEKYMQGYLRLTNYEVKDTRSADFNSKAHHWIMKNAPAFKEEPHMTDPDDYVSKINFALSHVNFPGQPVREIMGSWQKFNSDLIDHEGFGKTIQGSGYLKKQVETLIAGMTDPMQKLTAIFNYVKNNVEWDGTKDFYADSPKKTFEQKKGTSGDINLALASMLDKAGFVVEMVLLSTRDHGFVRQQYPMAKQFNYVVCSVKVGDKQIFLDATDRYLPINVLPERCLNGEGLVISKTNHRWINLEPRVKAKTVTNVELSLLSTGELEGSLQYTRDGYDAVSMRKKLVAKGQSEYIKEFFEKKAWSIEKSEFQNIEDIDKPVRENHTLKINDHVSTAGDVMYINPFLIGQISENPFKLEKREYPVDFGRPEEKIYMCKLTVPDGFKVDEFPQSKVLVLPGNAAKYTYQVSVIGNVVSILSNLQINKALFVQDEYPNLREFFHQLVSKQAEQIVLKKI